MSIKKFKKKETNRKKIIKILSTFMIVGIVLSGISYAVYQRESEVTFINAKVRWPKAGEVSYTTTYNTGVKNVEQALNDLYGKLGK